MSASAPVIEDERPAALPTPAAPAINRLTWAALAALIVGGGLMILYFTRGTTLWFDEWVFVVDRRQNTVGAFLEPHVGHLSIVPIVLYRVLFATVGIDDYLPYRFMIAAGEVAVVGLVFLYAARRVGGLVALLLAALVLFNAPAWQNSLWPFQIAWMISIGAGIAALMLLDRRDRLGDIGACALVAVALASCGVGIAVLVGVVVELVLGRRRWKDAWIALVPAVPYALWWALYQDQDWKGPSAFADSTTHPVITGLMRLPGFEIQSAASTLASLLGLSGTVPGAEDASGSFLQYGAPILAAALLASVLRLRLLGRIPVRVVSLVAIAVAFWGFTAITRGAVGEAYTSRYLFVGGVFVPLIAAELARGVRFQRWTLAAFGVVALAAVLSNLNVYRGASGFMQDQASLTRGALATFDVARGVVPPGSVINGLPGAPGVLMHASDYDAIKATMGSPAVPIGAIATLTEESRVSMDRELFVIYKATLGPDRAPAAGAKAPAVLPVGGRVTRTKGSCVTIAPVAVGPGAGQGDVAVTVPAGGLLIRGGTEGASVGLTRFGGLVNPLGRVGPGFAATVTMPPDNAPVPWTARLQFGGTVTACGLA